MAENQSEINEVNPVLNTHDWQRLSPIAIVYFAVSAIRIVAGNFIYTLPALVLGYKQVAQNPGQTLPLIAFLLALLVTYAVLSFYFYQYRLAEDSVEIKAGVLAKKHLNLPFSRIQNITLEQPIYYRISNYVCLELDTAGSAKQEAKIVAMPLEMGHELKQHILSKKEGLTAQTPDADHAEAVQPHLNEEVINTRSIKDLVIHGITNNRVWIILGAAAPFFDDISNSASSYLQSFGIDLQQIMSSQTIAWWEFGLYALSLVFLIMFLLALVSVAGSILVFYGFTLSKTHDRYVRRSGLLTRQEISMKLSRLQLIVRKQDWLDILLNRINLQFEQNNSGVKGTNELGNTNKILVPSVKEAECTALIDDAFPTNRLASMDFIPISKRFLFKMYVLWLLPLFGALYGMAIYHARYPEIGVLTLILAFTSFLVFMRWYRWGYAFDNDYIYVRKGMLGVDYYCFPIYKVQQAHYKQSLFMKRHHLATCKLVLASGAISIPFIPESTCHNLIDSSIYIVESQKRSWM